MWGHADRKRCVRGISSELQPLWHSYNVCVSVSPCVLTLLGFWGARRNFLVGVNRGFRRQAVKLFTADQVDLLEVLHLLLQKKKRPALTTGRERHPHYNLSVHFDCIMNLKH